MQVAAHAEQLVPGAAEVLGAGPPALHISGRLRARQRCERRKVGLVVGRRRRRRRRARDVVAADARLRLAVILALEARLNAALVALLVLHPSGDVDPTAVAVEGIRVLAVLWTKCGRGRCTSRRGRSGTRRTRDGGTGGTRNSDRRPGSPRRRGSGCPSTLHPRGEVAAVRVIVVVEVVFGKPLPAPTHRPLLKTHWLHERAPHSRGPSSLRYRSPRSHRSSRSRCRSSPPSRSPSRSPSPRTSQASWSVLAASVVALGLGTGVKRARGQRRLSENRGATGCFTS